MPTLAELNQRQKRQDGFWDWINQMNTNLPHRPNNNAWAEYGTVPATDNAGEGPSQNENEKAAEAAAEHEAEMVDPPTPPEHAPNDDEEEDFEDPFGSDKEYDNYPPPPPPPPGYEGEAPRGGNPWGPHPSHDSPAGPPPPHAHGPHHRGRGAHRGGPHGGRGGRGRGGRGGHGHGPGPFGQGPFGGPFGPFGGPFGGMHRGGMHHGGPPFGRHPFAFAPGQQPDWQGIGKKFMESFGLGGAANNRGADGGNKRDTSNTDGVDFEPPVDVYDTPTSFVIHVSLPGAEKDDVAATWDESKSALTIAGVVTRDSADNLADHMAFGERDCGLFRRVVKLGDKENPASVDADNIEAKLEAGVLKLKVLKTEAFVEVKKVQIN